MTQVSTRSSLYFRSDTGQRTRSDSEDGACGMTAVIHYNRHAAIGFEWNMCLYRTWGNISLRVCVRARVDCQSRQRRRRHESESTCPQSYFWYAKNTVEPPYKSHLFVIGDFQPLFIHARALSQKRMNGCWLDFPSLCCVCLLKFKGDSLQLKHQLINVSGQVLLRNMSLTHTRKRAGERT